MNAHRISSFSTWTNDKLFIIIQKIFISSTSDKNLKVDIKPIENANKLLEKVNPCYFKWRKETNIPVFGVIAQDINKIAPNMVYENNGFLSVDYTQFIPLLISSHNKLSKKIKRLFRKLKLKNQKKHFMRNKSIQNTI